MGLLQESLDKTIGGMRRGPSVGGCVSAMVA